MELSTQTGAVWAMGGVSSLRRCDVGEFEEGMTIASWPCQWLAEVKKNVEGEAAAIRVLAEVDVVQRARSWHRTLRYLAMVPDLTCTIPLISTQHRETACGQRER